MLHTLCFQASLLVTLLELRSEAQQLSTPPIVVSHYVGLWKSLEVTYTLHCFRSTSPVGGLFDRRDYIYRIVIITCHVIPLLLFLVNRCTCSSTFRLAAVDNGAVAAAINILLSMASGFNFPWPAQQVSAAALQILDLEIMSVPVTTSVWWI